MTLHNIPICMRFTLLRTREIFTRIEGNSLPGSCSVRAHDITGGVK